MKLDDMERGLAALDDGIWVGDLPQTFFKGIRLKVRRLWNDEYTALYGQLVAALPRDANGEVVTSDEQDKALTDECLKKTVLIDWEGVEDPCSPENIERVFKVEKLRRVWRSAIILAATRAADSFAKSLEADTKN